jgi:prevent-host-death family protein
VLETISASEFKAKCLDILARVSRREVERLIITKRGAPVAMIVPPPTEEAEVERLYGWQRGSVVIPPGVDLTAPVVDEPFDAEEGKLHR